MPDNTVSRASGEAMGGAAAKAAKKARKRKIPRAAARGTTGVTLLVYTEVESRPAFERYVQRAEPFLKIFMVILFTIIHVIVCFFLIVVVLLQSGQAADLAGAFGGMGSQTAFGPRGSATLMSKATTAAAVIFMITSITLSIYAQRNAASTGSVLEHVQAPAKTTAPAAPAQKSNAPVAPPPAQPQPANKK